ncbi:fad nad binding oxidoreductase [Moniliophthora roreri MCA 2997]|uniref:Fad nad binding oxidoreductase n=2 Tax=Moniliophthora roreri TaxID=221103 RepID=V2XUA9_MONRO|nr:fad nad binding oxidoreductase [Moniliophthora roreri MCA 2997]
MSGPVSKDIVIVGGGIIGSCTAYYLSRHPLYSPSTCSIKVIEASLNGIAQGASGKAGGLVAKWAYPSELVNVSFPEHLRLAEEHDGKGRWGFRFVQAGSWEGSGLSGADDRGDLAVQRSLEKLNALGESKSTIGDLKSRKAKGLPEDLTWVEEYLTDEYSDMAPVGATAQVHPYLFTTSMMELAKERGVKLIQGRVTSINREKGQVSGVAYSTKEGRKTVSATEVILTAGPWSPSLIPSLPIDGMRAHSITIHPETTISPYALFTSITLSESGRPRVVTPELYARPGNEVYACGSGDDCRLPETVDDVQVDSAAIERVIRDATSISPELRNGKIDKRQACFLPVVKLGGGPIVGAAPKIAKGLYIATGHTCWGICNAPGTGKAMAELVLDGKVTCTSLKKLDPSRFL